MKFSCQAIFLLFLFTANQSMAMKDTLRITENSSLSIIENSQVLATNIGENLESVQKNTSWQLLKSDYRPPQNKAIWIHFFIENLSNTTQKIFIRNPDNEISEYYIFEEDKLISIITNGEFVSTMDMNERQVVGVDSFGVKSKKTIEVYIKASNYNGILPFLRVFPQKSIRTRYSLKNESNQNIWFNTYYVHNINELQVRTFYQGGLGVIFFIILLIYYQNRSEKLYKYYLFYVFSAFVFTLIKSRAFTYVGKIVGMVPFLKIHGGELVMWLGFAAYLVFVAELLDFNKNHQKLYRFIINTSKAFVVYGIGIFLWLILTNDSGLQSKLFIITRIPLVAIYIGILVITARKVQSTMVKYVILSNGILIVFGLIAWLKAGLLNHQVWYGIFNHLFTLPFAILLEIIVFALAIAQKIGEERQSKNEIEKKAIEVEMMALRSQMNPHFIFNSLNSIRYFVISDQKEKAKEYITKFSKLLRTILNFSKEETITLQEEIEVLKTYLEIESARFDDSFKYEFIVDESIELEGIRIPPMILQPYIENALLHGLRNSNREDKELIINILEEKESVRISIRDNGIGRKESKKLNSTNPNKSFGTQITDQRIELFNPTSHLQISSETIDLDEGTEVIITINLKSSF
jgi:sensor histidine kinase YesM